MDIPAVISDRVATLSAECGTPLRIVSYWENEFRPGWYCRFRGVGLKSDFLVIELAGTLAVELVETRSDEVDMFIFVNGVRVTNSNPKSPGKYLWRRGSEQFRWDYLDDGIGYDQFDSLDNGKWRLDESQ
jgi:hypothetical protein